MNLYGFAGGDPINHSDPFGLSPWPLLGLAGGGSLAIGGTVGLGAVAVAAVPYVAAAAVVAGAVYLGQHARAVDRVRTSLGIAEEHITAAGGPPPGGEDPDWMNDKLKQAQKHLNNARKYVKDALGKTRRELEEQIGEQQGRLDAVRQPSPGAKP